MRDGKLDGMQDFDSVLLDMIEQGIITEEDGLSFATNQNNLLLQLKGLGGTDDFLRNQEKQTRKPASQINLTAEPTVAATTTAGSNGTSILNMIE
jgi:Tfp pilus assembly ATPase PilU